MRLRTRERDWIWQYLASCFLHPRQTFSILQSAGTPTAPRSTIAPETGFCTDHECSTSPLRSSCLHAIRAHGVYSEAAAAAANLGLEESPLAFDRVCLCPAKASPTPASPPRLLHAPCKNHPTLGFPPPPESIPLSDLLRPKCPLPTPTYPVRRNPSAVPSTLGIPPPQAISGQRTVSQAAHPGVLLAL